jgi:hypothetical protein
VFSPDQMAAQIEQIVNLLESVGILPLQSTFHARVAQLDSVAGFEPGGVPRGGLPAFGRRGQKMAIGSVFNGRCNLFDHIIQRLYE